MTCRAARLFSNPTRLDLLYCCRCGSTDLGVSGISTGFGPYLCPICVQSVAEGGVAKGLGTERIGWFVPS